MKRAKNTMLHAVMVAVEACQNSENFNELALWSEHLTPVQEDMSSNPGKNKTCQSNKK
jgi:hypothetical protein